MLTTEKVFRFVASALLLAALGWLLWVGAATLDEGNFRTDLRENGRRFDATVVEAGFERPDTSLLGVHVRGPFGELVGIDLDESDVRVHRVGDSLRVVVPEVPYHRGLPEDVVDRSIVPFYLDRLWLPSTFVLASAAILVTLTLRTRMRHN